VTEQLLLDPDTVQLVVMPPLVTDTVQTQSPPTPESATLLNEQQFGDDEELLEQPRTTMTMSANAGASCRIMASPEGDPPTMRAAPALCKSR
jgi:hypothetical protein